MKKLISLLSLLLIISTTMFTSCDPEPKPEDSKEVKKEFAVPDMELDGMKPESSWAYFTKDLGEFAGKEVTMRSIIPVISSASKV